MKSRDEAVILKELKSGNDVAFRYQTKDSYANNSFSRMKLGLKGSRKAIEKVEVLARQDRAKGLAAAPKQNQPSEASPDTPSPAITFNGSGKSTLVNDTKNGDQFCDAAELSEYPPLINTPKMAAIKDNLLNDAYSVKYVAPVSLDFVDRGTTVWHHFPSNGTDIALYSKGAARARGSVIRNGMSFHETRWQGTWKQDPGQGL